MNDNTLLNETYEAWANITMERWMGKLEKLGIDIEGPLGRSITNHVITSAGGDVARIEFFFNFYGKFVDMGVGRGVKIGDVKMLRVDRRLEGRKHGNLRRPRPWFSKTFYAERMKLIDILQRKYALKANLVIVNAIEN